MLKKIIIPKSIILLIILAFALNILRVILFDKFSFIYILWNIFLAFIPFLISSILLYYKENDKLNKTVFIIGSILWVVFIPNAPYIITDLIHIGVVRSVPVLYDSILLFTSAWVGLLLGMSSIFHMEKIFLYKYSKKITSFIIIIILLLTSFGMYLGRFFRFNSWDIFTSPIYSLGKLFSNLTSSAYHIEALIYILLFFVFLYVSYSSWKYSNLKQ
jgi:uncharacterized membrane protein